MILTHWALETILQPEKGDGAAEVAVGMLEMGVCGEQEERLWLIVDVSHRNASLPCSSDALCNCLHSATSEEECDFGLRGCLALCC